MKNFLLIYVDVLKTMFSVLLFIMCIVGGFAFGIMSGNRIANYIFNTTGDTIPGMIISIILVMVILSLPFAYVCKKLNW